jgi:hypothetical protein
MGKWRLVSRVYGTALKMINGSLLFHRSQGEMYMLRGTIAVGAPLEVPLLDI